MADSTQSTSLVKHLQILPGEPIVEPEIWPSIPLDHLSIHLIPNISVLYYRELYTKTGAMWLWTDRNFMSDDTLLRIISDPEITIHVLRVDTKGLNLPQNSDGSKQSESNQQSTDTSTKSDATESSLEDAGYFELEWRTDAAGDLHVEVSYFGLMPKFIGLRIGQWYLWELLKTVRNKGGEKARIWVHTCNWDHPKAYQTYIRGGFKWFKEETEPITIPAGYKHCSQK